MPKRIPNPDRPSLAPWVAFAIFLVALVIYSVMTRQSSSLPDSLVIVEQPTVSELVTNAEGVVSNNDGSVTISGSASFTLAPVSSKPPTAMVPESEAKKLSSPPK